MEVAGIVLYNPEEKRLIENLDAIYKQVKCVILVDNGSQNVDQISAILRNYSNSLLIRNDKNLGIATALNQLVSKAKSMNAEWVLTLDQDSVCQKDIIDKYKDFVKDHSDAAIVSCVIEDRNVGKPVKDDFDCEYEKIEFCITSASFTNVEKIREIGGFDDKLFIDMVDYDICYAARRAGYSIYRINYVGLLHEVGHSEEHKFLGKHLIAYNHSALRKYYWSRNSIYFVRKYNLGIRKGLVRVFKRIVITLLYEKEKKQKVMSLITGIVDGFKMNLDA